MILKTDEKKIDVEEAARRANEWAMQQLRDQDAKFDRDMKKAEQFKEMHFNKYAESDDAKNADVMRQYTILVNQAIRDYDDRLTRTNLQNKKIHTALLEKKVQSQK